MVWGEANEYQEISDNCFSFEIWTTPLTLVSTLIIIIILSVKNTIKYIHILFEMFYYNQCLQHLLAALHVSICQTETEYNIPLLGQGILSISSVQSLSQAQFFATPWIAAHQASLTITNSQSSLKLTSIKSVMHTYQ